LSIERQARVLVTGASGDSAQGVIRALRAANQSHFIAGVCIHERNPGFLMSDVCAVAPAFRYADAYIDFLVEFIHQNDVNVLIPTVDGELPLISERRAEIEARSGVQIVIGSRDAVLTCCDKLATCKYLAAAGVHQPRTISGGFEGVRHYIEAGNTVIMKPRLGGGSRGIRLLDTAALSSDDWMADGHVYQHFERYEKEFTAVVMKDGVDVVAMVILERVLSGGRTVWCRRVRPEPYEAMLKTVASGLDLPYVNIQFGAVGVEFQVFDLNPRFSGSTSVFALVFNGPDLLARKALSGKMPSFSCSTRYFESMRYQSDVVVDRLPNE
jgi:carbamoyl-phosphate synthase large subunit